MQQNWQKEKAGKCGESALDSQISGRRESFAEIGTDTFTQIFGFTHIKNLAGLIKVFIDARFVRYGISNM